MSPRGRRKGNSGVFWELARDGPKPLDRYSGGQNPAIRSKYDMRKFNVSSGRNGRGFPDTRTVLYLNEYHSVEEIVDVWVEINEDTLEKHAPISQHSLRLSCSKEFGDEIISREYLWLSNTYEPGDGGGYKQTGGTCPMCGGEYDLSLPVHLRGECPDN